MKTCAQLIFFISITLTSCVYSPGLYTDRVDIKIPDTPLDEKEQMGEQFQIVPITANNLIKIFEEKEQNQRMLFDLPVPDKSDEEYNYKIGRYDVLSVTVWDHPDLNLSQANPIEMQLAGISSQPVRASGHTVDSEGNIFFPHIGEVHVAGMTISQARKMLTRKLTKFIPDPQLDLTIADYRSKRAYILGEIAKPGALPLGDKPIHLLEAVALKGGLTQNADIRSAILIRNGKSYPIDFEFLQQGNLTRNFLLRDCDILTVPDNRLNRVFVIGEMNTKGNRTVLIPRGDQLNLADAITSAGGFNLDTVDPGKIFVFRFEKTIRGISEHETGGGAVNAGKPKIFHLDASSAESMLLAAQFPMRPLDVVYVGTKDIVRWNRLVAQILPTLQAIWYPVRAMRDWDEVING